MLGQSWHLPRWANPDGVDNVCLKGVIPGSSFTFYFSGQTEDVKITKYIYNNNLTSALLLSLAQRLKTEGNHWLCNKNHFFVHIKQK